MFVINFGASSPGIFFFFIIRYFLLYYVSHFYKAVGRPPCHPSAVLLTERPPSLDWLSLLLRVSGAGGLFRESCARGPAPVHQPDRPWGAVLGPEDSLPPGWAELARRRPPARGQVGNRQQGPRCGCAGRRGAHGGSASVWRGLQEGCHQAEAARRQKNHGHRGVTPPEVLTPITRPPPCQDPPESCFSHCASRTFY